jgi:hypothetical protein
MLLIAAARSDISRHLCPADSLINLHTSSTFTASIMRLSAGIDLVNLKGNRYQTSLCTRLVACLCFQICDMNNTKIWEGFNVYTVFLVFSVIWALI